MASFLSGPIFFVSGNLLSSVALILINKRVVSVDRFHFMSVLSGIHFYFSFITCCILLCFGLIRHKPVNNYLHLLRIALISKLACIPITLLLETFLNRRQQILSYKMIASLLFIMFGMGLVAVNEISFNVEGFIWAAAGVLCSSCAQIFFSPLQKELNLDALQMLFHLSPILTIGSFATIPLFENVTELIRFDINSKVVIDIGMSCCMAVLLNTSNYLVLSWASPLTYQVLGHIKSIFILIFGVFVYDAIPTPRSVIGMILAMVGVILYTEENRQQLKARQSKYIPVVQMSETDSQDESKRSIVQIERDSGQRNSAQSPSKSNPSQPPFTLDNKC